MTLSWLMTTALTNAALATLLALVALAISRLFPSPALTHLLWIVVLLKLLTPPLIHVPVAWKLAILPEYAVGTALEGDSTHNLQSPSNNTAAVAHLNVLPSQPAPTSIFHQGAAQRTTAFAPSRNLPVARPGTSRRPLAATLIASANSAIACLPAIWVSGAAVILVLAAYRAWRFLRFLRIAGDIDAALANRLASLARQTKLPAVPKLIVVQGVISPLLWGIGSSTRLIFPARLARELSQPQCDALLLHELAHYSRGDQWVRLLELLSQAAFWWHPIVWWAGKEIEAAEEQCCDAWVIQHRSATRRTYAEALLATIDFLSDQPGLLPPAASGLGDVPFLKLRLHQIMRGETAATLHLAVKLPILVTALILLPLGPTGSTASATSARSPISTHKVSLSDPSPALNLSAPREPATGSAVSDKPEYAIAATRLPDILPVRPITFVTATAISPNGKYRLERRKGDQAMLVHENGSFRLSMTDHRILCASFTPDSRLFVTGHGDSQVRVWDSQTGGLVAALKGNTAAVCSLDVTARAADGYSVAAGAQDGSVLVWDLASGEELAHLGPFGLSVSCLRWSRNGERVAISYGDFSDEEQAALVVWSPRHNTISHEAALPRPVAALAWLPGADSLLAADWTGEALLWQLADRAPAQRISLGSSGKQIAEAAHWSADCPLIPSWLMSQLPSGAD